VDDLLDARTVLERLQQESEPVDFSILLLRYEAELPLTAISEIVGLDRKTVATRLDKIRTRAGRRLGIPRASAEEAERGPESPTGADSTGI
jgi:DNA-directed RNA polymerase specialized sigma24 family protein